MLNRTCTKSLFFIENVFVLLSIHSFWLFSSFFCSLSSRVLKTFQRNEGYLYNINKKTKMTQARQQKKLCFLSCTSDFSMLQKWTVALWWYFTSFINKWYSAYKLLSLYYMLQSDIRNVFGFYSPPQTHPKSTFEKYLHI